jgi:hypothetical protein
VVGPEGRWSPASPTICAPPASGLRALEGRRAARRFQGLHQGSVREIRHPDRRLRPLRQRRARRRRPMCARRARRSSSRPTACRRQGRDGGDDLAEALAAIDDCFSTAPSARPARRSWSRSSSTGEEASFFASVRRQARRCRSARRRTTSASATAIPARTPAAWAPIRRPRS